MEKVVQDREGLIQYRKHQMAQHEEAMQAKQLQLSGGLEKEGELMHAATPTIARKWQAMLPLTHHCGDPVAMVTECKISKSGPWLASWLGLVVSSWLAVAAGLLTLCT